MMFSIVIQNPKWIPLVVISQGEMVEKGRKSPLSKHILRSAETIPALYGCYGWFIGEKIAYVGSFSPYQGKPNGLQARLGNYLGNHKVKENGSFNTNKMVFDKANESLVSNAVTIAYFRFESMNFGDRLISFEEFSCQAVFTKAVEELLICTYRLQGACDWNRT
jgi:hypothetical protein